MSEHKKQLVWNPVYNFLKEQIGFKRQLRLVIVPFVKIDALKQILEICEDISHLKIIVRWSGQDIINRVSDLEIYPYLKEKRVPLYINPSIHLKLYVFDDTQAFHSSSNITLKGLGITSRSNIEIGCMVRLAHEDWENIYSVLQESERVDDLMYEKAFEYLKENDKTSRKIPPLDLKPSQDKQFSLLSLPASPNPESLYKFYQTRYSNDEEMTNSYVHDLIYFNIQDNLSQSIFFQQLKEKFTKHPFVQAIVNLIRQEKSARFGLVNEWIQENCSDKPTPYKWEIKNNTHYLYNWLEYFFEEITWDRPNYSQVLRWRNN